MRLEEAIEKGYLEKINIDKELISKEINESDYDFESANREFKSKDWKSTIVRAYYSMFHASKALLFSMGYKERKHIGILIILQYLENEAKLEKGISNDFKAALFARESADYKYTYSKERAESMLKIAENFNKNLKKALK